jgi:hypothetical protein
MHVLNLNVDRWSLIEDADLTESVATLEQILDTGIDISASIIPDLLNDVMDWDTREYVH